VSSQKKLAASCVSFVPSPKSTPPSVAVVPSRRLSSTPVVVSSVPLM